MSLSNGASAVVQEITDKALHLDFNPPMAGKALTFEVELLSLTKVRSSWKIDGVGINMLFLWGWLPSRSTSSHGPGSAY